MIGDYGANELCEWNGGCSNFVNEVGAAGFFEHGFDGVGFHVCGWFG